MDSPSDTVGSEKARVAFEGFGEISNWRVVSGDQRAKFSTQSQTDIAKCRTDRFSDSGQPRRQIWLGGHELRIGLDGAKPPVGRVSLSVIDGDHPMWWGVTTT